MEAWKSVVALAVAGVFAVGPVWAQTTPADKTMDKGAAGKTEKGAMTPADKTTTGTADKTGDKASRGGEMKAGKGERMHKGDAAMSQDQVRAAQQALKDKGHDPGPVDGKMGPKTKAALKDFQKAQGLNASGRLDDETMAKLEMKTGAAMPSASPSTSTGADTKSDAAKPDAAAPSASPSTGSTDTTKPADPAKPAEEEKKQ